MYDEWLFRGQPLVKASSPIANQGLKIHRIGNTSAAMWNVLVLSDLTWCGWNLLAINRWKKEENRQLVTHSKCKARVVLHTNMANPSFNAFSLPFEFKNLGHARTILHTWKRPTLGAPSAGSRDVTCSAGCAVNLLSTRETNHSGTSCESVFKWWSKGG